MDNAVMDSHSFSAYTAQNTPLQQCWPFAHRTELASVSKPQRVLAEVFLVGFKLFPSDVARMDAWNNKLPIGSWHFCSAVLAIRQAPSAHTAVHECARVARIVQHLEHARVRRLHPMQLTLVHALADAAREPETLFVKELHNLHCGSGPFEGFEDHSECRLNFRIGVQTQNPVFPVDKSDRRSHLELASSSFIEHSASHPGFEEMKFCLRHGPLQTEQKPIV